MIKYKVKDAATDLGVPNKKITEILKKHCNVDKKTMTALAENELDVIFDVLTRENSVPNFDRYFAVRNAKLEREQAAAAQAKEQETKEEKKAETKPVEKKDGKPAAPAPGAKTAQPKEQKSEAPNHQRKRKVIDTRATNVDVERYNSKYDDLASDTSKSRSTDRDHTTKKQKFSNRTQKQKGRRQGKRETEAERLKRIALERKQKPITVQIPDEITVNELALRLKATVAEVVKKAFLMGTMVTATDTIDFDTASLIAMEFHAKVEKEVVVTIEEKLIDDSEDDEANLVGRAPVVVVMGHVDHGKTSILDAIRHANVTAGEAGGITQHIGAYRVQVNGKPITFLDTPGHEAFTTMRARGAQVTDIAILVVAADDGIMPQTVEAINHAKAAGVSVIVAINKMDKVGANPEQVKQQLTEYDLIPEEWGGDTPCIPVSAKTKEGLEDLLEMVALVAEMKELRANPDRAAKGTVIEARLDKGRGPIATVLVQNGTLHKGDTIIAGTTVGRVRVMTNDKGERVQEAGPSVPVEITGLDEVPVGGDVFDAVSDERLARTLVEQRKSAKKEEIFNAQTKVTLDNLFDQMKLGEVKELQIIVKADVQGSVEATARSAPSTRATSCSQRLPRRSSSASTSVPTRWRRHMPRARASTCACTASSTTASMRSRLPSRACSRPRPERSCWAWRSAATLSGSSPSAPSPAPMSRAASSAAAAVCASSATASSSPRTASRRCSVSRTPSKRSRRATSAVSDSKSSTISRKAICLRSIPLRSTAIDPKRCLRHRMKEITWQVTE